MTINREDITGIILAGNKNLPGLNKMYAEVKEEITIRTLYNLLSIYCTGIIISSNHPYEYTYLDAAIVPDEIEGIGPIGSILSCLKQSTTQKNLIVAIDMPMVPAGLLQLLVKNIDEADFVVPASGKEIEPLCAIYDKSIIPVLDRMIQERDYDINNLKSYCSTALIQVYNGNNIFKNRLRHLA